MRKFYYCAFLFLFFNLLAFGQNVYIQAGSEWKYLDDGSDQGTVWKDPGFNDSGWKTGKGQFGFGEGDEKTVLNKGYITYYFRKKINISDTSKLNKLAFRIVHDDAMVLYVNGVEISRSALLPQTGAITYLTGTSTFIPNANENDFWDYPVDKSFFKPGENTIAIEVHNQNATSSDVSFDCQLVDNYGKIFDPDGPYVFHRDGKVHVKFVEPKGFKTQIFNDRSSASLVCRFLAGKDSFAVKLKTELKTEKDCIFELPKKFLAISDIEGNLEGFILLLKKAGVINEKYEWTFEKGHLFIAGDMMDRGDNVTECLWLVYKLEQEAEKQGGKVHFVLGNHDFMNMTADFRYVNTKYVGYADLMGEAYGKLYSSESELGQWLRTKNFIENIGGILVNHAGISPAVANLGLKLPEINNICRTVIDSGAQTNAAKLITGGSASGVFWYRGMAQKDLTQQQVDSILASLNANKIIIGHTIFDDISLLYNKRVIAIDLEHEINYTKGFMKGLYFEDNKFYNLYVTNTEVTKTLIDEISALPVELTSFYTAVSEGKVKLNWSTASELNNKGFAVERKSSDGEFSEIAFIKGHGTSVENKNYSFTDIVKPGLYVYRLKQVDFDGGYKYSKQTKIDLTVPGEFALLQNYPNPFNPSTSIEVAVPVKGKYTLKIYDMLGRVVSILLNGQLEAGRYTVNFNAAGLSSGAYFYALNGAEKNITRKMILAK